MKLDPKITVSHKDILNCYDVNSDFFENIIEFLMPLKGYFSFRLGNFFDLSRCDYGTLDKVDETDNEIGIGAVFHRSEDDCYYPYFLPECCVKKEKKFRPFTIEEFCNEDFDIVVFRKKKGNVELHLRYNGYTYSKERGFSVLLGCEYFSLEELFNNYELRESAGWVPFGVEE